MSQIRGLAELAGADGMPPPSDLPRGGCIMTTLPGGGLRIDHADPQILISAPLLYQIFEAPAPGVSLGPEPPQRDHWDGHGYWEGALLKVCGVNRTVVYRIGKYVPRIHGYIAEWPD